jgi:hypothetical protein
MERVLSVNMQLAQVLCGLVPAKFSFLTAVDRL